MYTPVITTKPLNHVTHLWGGAGENGRDVKGTTDDFRDGDNLDAASQVKEEEVGLVPHFRVHTTQSTLGVHRVDHPLGVAIHPACKGG